MGQEREDVIAYTYCQAKCCGSDVSESKLTRF